MGLEDTKDEFEYVRYLRSRSDAGPALTIDEWRSARSAAARSKSFRTARPLRPRVNAKRLRRNRAT